MADTPVDNQDPEGPGELYRFWKSEIDIAGKAIGLRQWVDRSKKIIRRYRDERSVPTTGTADTNYVGDSSKFNILWSNVQTLLPALYAKPPKTIVERRYLDRDPIGRTASVILERAIGYQIEEGGYNDTLKKCVLDRLLSGRGTLWVRYEPTFRNMPAKTQETDEQAKSEGESPADEKQEEAETQGETEQEQEVIFEKVCSDYVGWEDFLTSPARTWEDVRWVAKRVYMDRAELEKRFPKVGSEITLDYTPQEVSVETNIKEPEQKQFKKAKIWEIWNKPDRKVRWLAEGYPDALLDEQDDPLRLEAFFPCPKPLFATLTNESLVPVPDFYEYQDQATELDELTSRISQLTKAIKVIGFYDGGQKDDIARIFEEGFENKMIAVSNWAQFSEKGKAGGVMSLFPVQELIETVQQLYIARDSVKQTLYEITGISDIVRGANTGQGEKTATEQRIKGQFASMRLNSMQAEVARFARDTLRLQGEIIAEHFDPMTLFLVSGYEQYAKDQFPPEPMPNPMMGHNGGPPMPPGGVPPQPAGAGPQGPPPGMVPQPNMMPPGQPIMAPPDPAAIARQKAADTFQAAIKLLRDDKLRGFRIDIETDSMIEADKQATQQARTELLTAISQFLPEALQAGAQVPTLQPLMGKLLLFFLRGFSASRDIESAFEQAIDQMEQAAKNPPPQKPDPEQIKADAMMAKTQLDMKAQQEKMAGDQQAMQLQAQVDQQKAQGDLQIKQAEWQIERERLQAESARMAQEMEFTRSKHDMEMQRMQYGMSADRHEALIGAAEREHQHGLTIEIANKKAEQAKKPNGGK